MAQILLPHPHRKNFIFITQQKIRKRKGASPMRQNVTGNHDLHPSAEESIARIKEKFGKINLSVSSYDTAWVAMVPSRVSPTQPCFPECLDWVMENQQPNGSWGLHPTHPSLVKDSLSCTLACVLALQKWGVGQQLVNKGLDFIRSNGLIVTDKHQSSPIGFEIIFPGMIDYANELGLNLPLEPALVDVMHRNRDLEVERASHISFAKGDHLAYYAEGLRKSYNWKELMKYQRSNGSLFNSPATTAAALTHLHDDKCFDYLQSLVKINGKAVPTIYPCEIYVRLCIVDTLEKLGIDRYFKNEIENVLSETYRCWQEGNEEIFLDVACCSMAFRLLRMNGYEVAPDALAEFVDQEHFYNTACPRYTNTETIIELYRASQIKIFQNELILDKIDGWTSTFLKCKLVNQEIYEERLQKKVEYALDYFTLDRLENRRNIELYNADNFRMLKTAYRCSNIDNIDFLLFSMDDFNKCQAIYKEEIGKVKKWVIENKLDSLKWEWHTLISTHFLLAATLFSPDSSDARIATCKCNVIGTIVDDMFDIDGSTEELLSIVELVDRWDENSIDYCSKRIELLIYALHEFIKEFATRGFIQQGRCVKQELIDLWLDYIKCSLREVNWWTDNITPTMDEYITNGCSSIGAGIFFINNYFVGVKLSEDVVKSEEYKTLYKHVGTIGRLFNDYRGFFERETEERKMNSCLLLMKHSNGAITKEEAMIKIRGMIESSRREVLRRVIRRNGSLIPKDIKDTSLKLSKIYYFVYNTSDEYRIAGGKINDKITTLYEPLNLPPNI